MKAATPQPDAGRVAAIRTRRLEYRLAHLACRIASITSKLAETQEELREANNHNVEIINIATSNNEVLRDTAVDLIVRIEKLEAWKSDSIFGHEDTGAL